MKVLYFDCFSGASGDMIVGALIDAGVPLDEIRAALGSLTIDPDAVSTERVQRAGIGATKFQVRAEEAGHHDHRHTHGMVATEAHAHRTLTEIYALIDGSRLSSAGKMRAKSLFARLGEVEGAIHGTPADTVHLHEVGSLDSIVDIVSTVHALELIGAERIVASPLNVGSGTIRSSHGLYPVPAPATVRLLEGVPIYSGTQRAEMVTPTGALLITAYATEFGGIPLMKIGRIGYGAGARNFEDTPNVLRVLVGESDASVSSRDRHRDRGGHRRHESADLWCVDGETAGGGRARRVLHADSDEKESAGHSAVCHRDTGKSRAADVHHLPRDNDDRRRYRDMTRECLDRGTETVSTPVGPIRFKIAGRAGEVLNAAPEFDDCVRIANATGKSLKEIQATATKAWLDSRRP